MLNVTQKIAALIFRLGRPFFVRILNNTKRTRVVLVADEKVLLVKNWIDSTHNWNFPGGGVKKHETSQEAAAREIREEVGIISSPKELVSLGEFDITEGKATYSVELFVDVLSSTRFKKSFFGVSEAAWFPIAKLPTDRNDLVEIGLQQWRTTKTSS